MADELVDKKITQDEADRMMAPLELDLIAVFKMMEEDMITLVDDYEGTPEQFINEVLSMLTPEMGEIKKAVGVDKGKPNIYIRNKGL